MIIAIFVLASCARHAGTPPPEPARLLRGVVTRTDGALSFRPCGATAKQPIEPASAPLREQLFPALESSGDEGTYVELRAEQRAGSLRIVELRRAVPGEGPGCDAPVDYTWLARGNEPFWRLEVRENRAIFTQPDEPSRLELQGSGGTGTFRGEAPGHRVEARFVAGPCTDSMSGEYSSHRAEVTLDDRRLEGCAVEGLPAGAPGAR